MNKLPPFVEGEKAQQNGALLDSCPYPETSHTYIEWRAGWISSDMAAGNVHRVYPGRKMQKRWRNTNE